MTKRKLFDVGLSVRLLFCLLPSAVWLLTPVHAQNFNDADRACAMVSVYAKMGMSDDQIKALSIMCSQNPNPKAICDTLFVLKISNRTNPGLICTDRHLCEQYGLVCY
jgi:hypothetical protein